MAVVAVAIIMLLSLAIFSLSRLESAPWTSELLDLKIQGTLRKKLPQFEYTDGNKKLTPQNFEKKWTLLSFWSYTCPPCLVEMPALNQLAMSWSGVELEVMTVNIDEDKSEALQMAKAFLQDEEIELPTIWDKQKVLANAFAVNIYPKHFLINPQGEIIWEGQGAYQWDSQASRDQLVKLTEQQTPETIQDPVE